jgi:hypothetical protein
MPVLIIPLISYSILATVLAIYFYRRLNDAMDYLEAMPDQGENKGATHIKKGENSVWRPDPESALPSRLRVGLGQSLCLGQLEVTPLRVRRGRVQLCYENVLPDEALYDSIILDLELRNVSEDVCFRPLDPYFQRQWKADKKDGPMPYTYLTIGKQRFYGGPVPWKPGSRMIVAGQDLDRELNPGEGMKSFVCTDPDDPVYQALREYQGSQPIEWRVQVRRGLVPMGPREVCTTAVIGVEFLKKDIES